MKSYRYKLVYVSNPEKESKDYKTLKEIETELQVQYFQLREIYMMSCTEIGKSDRKAKKFSHPYIKALYEKIRIFPIEPEINI